jgi:hypothetical protein
MAKGPATEMLSCFYIQDLSFFLMDSEVGHTMVLAMHTMDRYL